MVSQYLCINKFLPYNSAPKKFKRFPERCNIILLDLSKAFDKVVSHIRLCHKLASYGIRGNTLEWIQSFLSGRSWRVVLNGKQSDSCTALSGVPRGSVLELLFLCYINDLPGYVQSSIRLYADDALIAIS